MLARPHRRVTALPDVIAPPTFALGGDTMEQTLEHTESDELVADDDTAEEELLVEEISIDGMCGVY